MSDLMIFGIVGFLLVAWILTRRKVVPFNEVHFVSKRKSVFIYGKDTTNCYWKFPHWIPLWGVEVVVLQLALPYIKVNCRTEDKEGKLWSIEVKCFFKFSDVNVAARCIKNEDIERLLTVTLEGACFAIFKNLDPNCLASQRSENGTDLRKWIDLQVKDYGVTTVGDVIIGEIKKIDDAVVALLR